jgi:hypothetical protein
VVAGRHYVALRFDLWFAFSSNTPETIAHLYVQKALVAGYSACGRELPFPIKRKSVARDSIVGDAVVGAGLEFARELRTGFVESLAGLVSGLIAQTSAPNIFHQIVAHETWVNVFAATFSRGNVVTRGVGSIEFLRR